VKIRVLHELIGAAAAQSSLRLPENGEEILSVLTMGFGGQGDARGRSMMKEQNGGGFLVRTTC
jgi:hypothetical protein